MTFDVAVDRDGFVYASGRCPECPDGAAGQDQIEGFWLAKFDPSQSGANSLLWITTDGVGQNARIAIHDSDADPSNWFVYSTGHALDPEGRSAVVAKHKASNGSWDEHDRIFLAGSNFEEGRSIAVDAGGNAYVTGVTASDNFPTTGGFDAEHNGGFDPFAAKLAPDLSVLYSTFLPGGADTASGGADNARGIAVDNSGNAYVVGTIRSADTEIPVGVGGYDQEFDGTADAFVAKISANGSALDYFTFLGGTDTELGGGIAVDGLGKAYITGATASNDFPVTNGAFDNTRNLSGDNVFVTKLNIGGTDLLYSTYLGGSGRGLDIALDGSGNAYVTGDMGSDFPTTPGAFQTTNGGGTDAFVTKFNLNVNGDGTGIPGTNTDHLIDSTFLGGTQGDAGRSIALDSSGKAYVVGITKSSDFPTTENALDTTFNGRGKQEDGFLAVLSYGAPPPPPPPSIFINDVSVTEGDSGTVTAQFTVTRSGNTTQQVTVDYRTVDGTATAGEDYSSVPVTTLTFAPGQTSQNVTITVKGDTEDESNEIFFVNLSNANGANITNDQGVGTIVDDDGVTAATMHVGDLDGAAQSSGKNWSAQVTITVVDETGKPVQDATVGYAWTGGFSDSGSGATNTSGQLTVVTGNIPKKQNNTTLTVTAVTHGTLTYEAADNTDPDGDSSGTSIKVFKDGTTMAGESPSAARFANPSFGGQQLTADFANESSAQAFNPRNAVAPEPLRRLVRAQAAYLATDEPDEIFAAPLESSTGRISLAWHQLADKRDNQGRWSERVDVALNDDPLGELLTL